MQNPASGRFLYIREKIIAKVEDMSSGKIHREESRLQRDIQRIVAGSTPCSRRYETSAKGPLLPCGRKNLRKSLCILSRLALTIIQAQVDQKYRQHRHTDQSLFQHARKYGLTECESIFVNKPGGTCIFMIR